MLATRDDFSTTQRCDINCCNILLNGCNIVPTLQRFVAQNIVVANRPVLNHLKLPILIHGRQQTKRMILKTSVELRLLSFKWNGPLHCGTRGRPIHTGLRISVMVLFTSYDNVVMLLFAKCTLLSLSGNLNRRIVYLCQQNEIQLFTEVIHKVTSKNHFHV